VSYIAFASATVHDLNVDMEFQPGNVRLSCGVTMKSISCEQLLELGGDKRFHLPIDALQVLVLLRRAYGYFARFRIAVALQVRSGYVGTNVRAAACLQCRDA